MSFSIAEWYRDIIVRMSFGTLTWIRFLPTGQRTAITTTRFRLGSPDFSRMCLPQPCKFFISGVFYDTQIFIFPQKVAKDARRCWKEGWQTQFGATPLLFSLNLYQETPSNCFIPSFFFAMQWAMRIQTRFGVWYITFDATWNCKYSSTSSFCLCSFSLRVEDRVECLFPFCPSLRMRPRLSVRSGWSSFSFQKCTQPHEDGPYILPHINLHLSMRQGPHPHSPGHFGRGERTWIFQKTYSIYNLAKILARTWLKARSAQSKI